MSTHLVHTPRLAVALLFGVVCCHAEGPPPATPVPELQKLASFVGVWNTSFKARLTPDSTTFESTSRETVRWSDSYQFLINEQRGRTPEGWTSRVLITSWNPADRQIHVVEVSPGGAATEFTLWFEGATEKLLGYRRFEGRLVRTELTVQHTSPDEYNFRYECTDRDKTWVCSEGISKRAK